MLLKRNLKTPPRSSFAILRPPIFHPKKIEGPPISPPPPPPPSNLNYDWSLTNTSTRLYDIRTRLLSDEGPRNHRPGGQEEKCKVRRGEGRGLERLLLILLIARLAFWGQSPRNSSFYPPSNLAQATSIQTICTDVKEQESTILAKK